MERQPYFLEAFNTDYDENGGENRQPCELEQANLISSEVIGRPGWHAPALDIDLPCTLVESTTPGHFHLYIDHAMDLTDYLALLEALAAAGIIEWGYFFAAMRRGATFLRKPGVLKEINPATPVSDETKVMSGSSTLQAGNRPLPTSNCGQGYPRSQLIAIIPTDELERFDAWMDGQTMSICDGRRYNHVAREYENTGCGPHGPVVYRHDLQRFLDRLPIID